MNGFVVNETERNWKEGLKIENEGVWKRRERVKEKKVKGEEYRVYDVNNGKSEDLN